MPILQDIHGHHFKAARQTFLQLSSTSPMYSAAVLGFVHLNLFVAVQIRL